MNRRNPKPVSDLFQAVIMTAVEYPRCFGSLSGVFKTIEANDMDVATAANAIARFLNDDGVHDLYICGCAASHAERFYEDLKASLDDEPEVAFVRERHAHWDTLREKRIIRSAEPPRRNPGRMRGYVSLLFTNTDPARYHTFDRKDLAAYVYCGNSSDGPCKRFECRSLSGTVCVLNVSKRLCRVCFRKGIKGKLDAIEDNHYEPEDVALVDEGVVAEPLGMPKEMFEYHFSDTDSSDTE
ncbi:ORF52 [Aviadenovirus phalacrocoracidae]|uniref:ORF52 n=1 Tax=Aviadenovirus sp. TaxID=2217649 RepID=A0ABZ0T1G3_9ADEN|nr:ORF52 [Aviadenovirus sp.]